MTVTGMTFPCSSNICDIPNFLPIRPNPMVNTSKNCNIIVKNSLKVKMNSANSPPGKRGTRPGKSVEKNLTNNPVFRKALYTTMNHAMPREELINQASEIKVIPTLGGIVNRVFSVLGNNNSSFNDLSDVVKYDQAISSKIISIANSAYYSRGVEIFSLQRAMLTIGFEEVRSIVTCLLLMEGIMKKLKLKEEDLLALWKHSIEVATAARLLSERLFIEDPQKVYTASLLHDIGKIVFYLSAPEYGEMLRETRGDILALESERFGIDHQEIGYIIAVKWKFPHDFSRVIRRHHGDHCGENEDALFRLVNASDRFFTRPPGTHSTEGFILDKERGAIAFEVDKIMKFLRLV